jgi:hypothetical protein
VELGGDSLTYVELSVRLEPLLGPLPPDWHRLPVAALVTGAAGRGRRPRLDVTVLLRAVGILAVVVSHATELAVVGGAHVLLAVTGFNLGRFQLAAQREGAPPSRLWSTVGRIAVPTAVWTGLVVLLTDELRWANVALLTPLVDAPTGQGLWRYWYVESLTWLLVAVAVLARWPRLRDLHRRRPRACAWGALGAGLLLRSELFGWLDGTASRFQPHNLVWVLALGWVAERATTTRERLAVSAVAVASVAGAFPEVQRGAAVVTGVLLLTWLRTVPLPARLHRPLGVLAGASLFVYLTHYQVLGLLERFGPAVAVPVALVVGVAVSRAYSSWTSRVMARTSEARAASA